MKSPTKYSGTVLITLASLVFASGCNDKSESTSGNSSAMEKATNALSTAYAKTENAISNVISSTNVVTTNVDNSGINVRDRTGVTLTPGDQGTSPADIERTQLIRKALVASTSDFSVVSKNVKIITVDGKVTLRGPVNTESEKNGIGAIATTIAGAGNVDNQLDVKPTQ
jgi:hyperosmotically inducible protein